MPSLPEPAPHAQAPTLTETLRRNCSCHPADDDSGHCIPHKASADAATYLGGDDRG